MLSAAASVPEDLEHPWFVAAPLTAELVELDYEAYMASPRVIAVHSDGRRPTDGFTLAENRVLVAGHEKTHRERRAFTYALLTPTRDRALGCLYLNPLRDYLSRAGARADLVEQTPASFAMVTFWLRQDEQDTSLADVVVEAVNSWLGDQWRLSGYFRVLPAERSSRAARERAGFEQVSLGPFEREQRPYLWYRHPGSPACLSENEQVR